MKKNEWKLTAQEAKIVASINFWDDGDISTERLLALVCDDCECEVDEVTAVLVKYFAEDN